MSRLTKVLLLMSFSLVTLGCGSDREKGMNKDKGFPRSETPKIDKKKGDDTKTPDIKKTDPKSSDTKMPDTK